MAGLQTTGKTVLGGRRGKADGGFNEGYAEGGSGGIGDGLAGLLGGGGGGIATKAKGSIKTPSERDIDMGAGGGSRSAADIMKVVRQRTPGLRHIYNKFLKKKPGFQGKVTLKFTIAPGGEIISISIASSTTGYGEFDGEVKTAVSRWKFSKVKSGNINADEIAVLVEFTKQNGGIDYAERRMQEFSLDCMNFIHQFVKEKAIRESLTAYVDYVIERNY